MRCTYAQTGGRELDELIERRRATGADRYDEVWKGEYHMAPAPRHGHALVDNAIAVLLTPAAAAAGLFGSGPSFGGVEFYPDFATKVAILGYRLARNHALPDGNKRTALLAMIEFAERNGRRWRDLDEDETVETMVQVAAGTMSEKRSSVGYRVSWRANENAGVGPDLNGDSNEGPQVARLTASTWRRPLPPTAIPPPQQLRARGRRWCAAPRRDSSHRRRWRRSPERARGDRYDE